ncbi:MAG TPA: family 78 glycoside hydrolase catalytic domain [Candidatus Saccharimonadales bacterium]|nr:family 78 glycoside hydrolase catalytic domain [Candidatus Saccharimonadales bacterium]
MPNPRHHSKSAPLRMALVFATMFLLVSGASGQTMRPVMLECESLTTPLGVDTKNPVLSWKIQDSRMGARQTAYQIEVASTAAQLAQGTADVWNSGRVDSGDSRSVVYAGPALQPVKRYYWRVLVWDQNAKAGSPGDPSWWETGLRDQKNWSAKWIGYEEPELRQVRASGAVWITNSDHLTPTKDDKSRHDFRLPFELAKPPKRALLYVTGQDSPGAWINGQPVLESQPLPPWRQMPWKTYMVRDATKMLRAGKNLLAIEIVRYDANISQIPMSAVLYVETADGRTELFKTGSEGWRAALNANAHWQSPEFNDASWNPAVLYVLPPSDMEANDLGFPWRTGAVKSLRRGFQLSKPVTSARIYATALGAYELSINGKNIGDEILAPGWMDFRQQVAYQTYDVTAELKTGQNALAALLAPGWYATPLMWFQQGNNYGRTPPALRAQLRIEFEDGTVEVIPTDEKWKADTSPILSAEIYDGETYDARRLQPGWNTGSFNDTHWKPAEIVQPAEPEILWQYFPPIRRHEVLRAKSVKIPRPGVYVFDFGQNLSGVARIRAKGPAGTDVRLRFAEILNADGTPYVDNLRTAKATDHFILSGKGREEFEPSFTFHGFRYVEVTGLKVKPNREDVQAVVFHTDAPFTAKLKTGNAMVNQLWSNIQWGQRSNFVGVPTDCPQRDERLGWTADAQVFWRAAAYNMDLTTFSRKFGADLRGTQVGTDMYGIFAPGTVARNPGYGTGWSDAGVIIPWTSWIQTGDKKVVTENWDGMEKYLAAIESQNPNYLWRKGYGIPFADWLAPEGVTPVDLIATAYWAYDATLMSEMAHAVGNTADEQKYTALFQKIKDAFNEAFVHADGFVGGVPPPVVFASSTGNNTLGDKPVETQTGYILALHMNLLPDALRKVAADRLVDRLEKNQWRLATGFLGTPYLLGVLADTGHADIAYRLLLNTDYPSWGYLIEHGATTMWERWDGDKKLNEPGMNSFNHYAYGAVADWIYRYAAGIDSTPRDPGFHTILLHPNFDKRLGSLDFSYESSYGTIHSAWSITGDTATWNLTVPANSTGLLPLTAEQEESYKLDGQRLSTSKTIRTLPKHGDGFTYELPAGSYRFEVSLPQPEVRR